MGGRCKKTILQLPGDRLASISPWKAKQVERFKEYARKRAKKKGITLPKRKTRVINILDRVMSLESPQDEKVVQLKP
jgi:hypothetical protein